jgi:ABC-type transport system involved in multi-copper enzyme maturation permease subunit
MALKKFYNKALLYKELKSSVAFIGIVWIALFMEFSYGFMNTTKNLIWQKDSLVKNGEYSSLSMTDQINWSLSNLTNSSYIFFSILSIILISSWIIGKERQNKKSEMLSTMPFSALEIVSSKWIIVISSILVGMLINLSLVLLNCSNSSEIYIYYPKIFDFIYFWILSKTLLYIFIATFIMFVSSLCGRLFTGGILGGIFLLVPFYLLGIVPVFLKCFETINGTTIISKSFMSNLEETFYNISNLGIDYDSFNFIAKFKIIIYLSIIFIIIFMILLMLSYKNNKIEKIGEISMFKSFEHILKIGVSICFSLLIPVLLVESMVNYNDPNHIEQTYLAFPAALVTFVVAYYVTHKIVKHFK